MGAAQTIIQAVGKARERLLDLLAPAPSPAYDQAITRLLTQLDDMELVSDVRQQVGEEAARSLAEALRAARSRGAILALLKERRGWVVRLEFEASRYRTEREFAAEELAELPGWIGEVVSRVEA